MTATGSRCRGGRCGALPGSRGVDPLSAAARAQPGGWPSPAS